MGGQRNLDLGAALEQQYGVQEIKAPQPYGFAGTDAWPERVEAIRATLAKIAQINGVIRDVHDVRVRETSDGEIVNFHCRVNPMLSVQTVHEKVDQVERALRRRSPAIKRVIGHAEPRTASGTVLR